MKKNGSRKVVYCYKHKGMMNQNKLSYDLFDKLLLTKFPQKKNVVDKDSHQTRNKSDNKKKKKERN